MMHRLLHRHTAKMTAFQLQHFMEAVHERRMHLRRRRIAVPPRPEKATVLQATAQQREPDDVNRAGLRILVLKEASLKAAARLVKERAEPEDVLDEAEIFEGVRWTEGRILRGVAGLKPVAFPGAECAMRTP